MAPIEKGRPHRGILLPIGKVEGVVAGFSEAETTLSPRTVTFDCLLIDRID